MKNQIKYLLTLIAVLFFKNVLLACEVCEKQQPKIMKGITHGAGPQSNWDWAIIGVITVITLLTFVYSLKYLIKPGEKESNHIKTSILNN
jgi:phage shock protein PspC (stress-responsive transcriptional regulator)